MEISRSRRHLVNVTNYENIEVGASVKLTDDDTSAFKRPEDAIKYANDVLDDLLREDLEEAWKNIPEGKSTHLDTWKDIVSGSDN